MAIINDLIAQIEYDGLRQRIDEELKRLLKQKKFGLVFEEHQPEGLTDERAIDEFAEEVCKHAAIGRVYLVVDSDAMYRELARLFPKRQTCQLYRDYLDNFRINCTR